MSLDSKPNAQRAIERCERLAKLGSPPTLWHPLKLRRWLASYRSIMALDISEIAEMMRDAYPASEIQRLAERPHPMLRMVPRSQRK